MTRRFAFGLATGVGAVLMASRFARPRRGISFDERVVVITGGSRGLGLVLAQMLVDEGARVAILARDGQNELEPVGVHHAERRGRVGEQ